MGCGHYQLTKQTMAKTKGYRHGENLLVMEKELPTEARALDTRVFAKGSHGNHHSIHGGRLYEHEGTRWLKAVDTSLIHPEHSPNMGDARIEDGIYKILTQTEFTPEGLKPVID